MAAEVPAKDVLCEAMEYLSKLGSNLRTRSENLREKKIRRDKLNNVLAVQKAATKVLLICELSKKSLENVETGIRKVLNIIDTSQASSKDGGKTTKTANSDLENKTQYYYFEYRSRKLKIRKRISLTHYTSVRVIAKRMPKSMIDNYPVHYDCKLYRMRERDTKFLESKNQSEGKPENEVKEVQQKNHKTNEHQDGDVSVITTTDTQSKSTSVNENVNVKHGEILQEIDQLMRPNSSAKKVDIECKRTSSETSVQERSCSSDREQPQSRTKLKDKTDDSEKNKTKDHHEKASCTGMSGEKHRKRSETTNETKDKKKKTRKLGVIESSSGDLNTTETVAIRSISDDSCDEPKSKRRKSSVSSNETQTDCIQNNVGLESVEHNSDKMKNQDSDSECKKPMIKCVSLNKLLKPDILVKKSHLSDKSPYSKHNDRSPSKHKATLHSKNEPRQDKKKVEKLSKREEYWSLKRKEVELFTSKPFVINITRLPDLSVDFIMKNHLKRISKGGIIICEIEGTKNLLEEETSADGLEMRIPPSKSKRKNEESSKNDTSKLDSTDKSDGNDEELIAEADKVKRSLLNESDSDDVMGAVDETFAIKDSNNFKKSLLNDSDSENKHSDGELQLYDKNKEDNNSTLSASAQKAKKSLCTETSSDSDKNELKNTFLADKEKNKSYSGSDSDTANKIDFETNVGEKVKETSNKPDSYSRNLSTPEIETNVGEKVKETSNKPDSYSRNLSTPEIETNVGEKVKETSNKPDSYSRNLSTPEIETNVGEKVKETSNKPDSYSRNLSTPEIETNVGEKVKETSNKPDSYSRNLSTPEIARAETDCEQNFTLTNECEPSSELRKKNPELAKTNEGSDSAAMDSDSNQNGENNINEEREHDLVEQSTNNTSELQRNEKTPERKLSEARDSDDKTKTPLSQRLTPQSKKKRMRESIHAKKMLLTYSSSDTEDEELKKALKEIKNDLLHGSDEENSAKKQEPKNTSRESSPSSSAEDIVNKVKRKISYNLSPKKVKRVKHKKHASRRSSSEDSKDEKTYNIKSSSRKMVHSKSKPGNSSSQSSDTQDFNDKAIDGLTNLDSLNKPKTRRRNSSASEMTEESSASFTRSRRTRVKPTGLISEEMLKAESSSDAVSVSGEENDNDEGELPSVTLPSLNGGVEHLVKEDLLGESDSSATHDESAHKDDSESDSKLNARRRKANAISSDSEVGSSRKKDTDVKLSDFEDSDDSEPTSRSKRKKKDTDSDASAASTSSKEAGKKKRRRIKSVKDSDVSGSDSDNDGRNKHGRKNIRKVMGKNQLEEATKKAAREEKERIARIAERQKMYNNLEFDESGKPDEVVLDKVVLDFDPETKEPLIEVDRGLVKKLKPHQANGIKFMWNACFESVKRIKKDKGSGCILAHCMGLGKTLQVVSLTHTLLTHEELTKVNRVLVVCPLSTVLNWVNEFKMWLKHAETDYEVDVYELSRYKQNSERAFQLSQWFQHGGVCVLGYEMFRNLSADNSKKFKKKMLKNFQEALVDPGPDLVVCDEGHLLKNEKTSLSQSMNRVRTLRRIVLTGTPLQNNLKEYYCMVQFVKPNLLGKYNEYLNRFVNPITNGQYTDSTEFDIKIMKRRSHVLHKMLDGAVQRRDYGVLAPFLPPKHEYVLFITLSEVQTKLYQHYLDNFSRRPLPGKSSGFLFPDFQSLQRIWTHPLVLKYNSERYEIMQQKKRDKEEEDSEGSLVDFIDDDSTPNETSTDESSDDSSEMSDDSRKKSKKKKSSKKSKGKDKDIKVEGGLARGRRGTRANPIEIDDDDKVEEIIEAKNENPTEWWIKLVEEEVLDDMRNSHKLVLLFDILRQCETIGDKLLVFSQSLYSLDLIEHFLGKVDEATQEGRIDEKLGGHVGSWSPGVDYFRLDGSTSCENRSIWCKNFNREDNPRARLFLISTRAGGLGINLVAANRVVIFDVSWNPSHDVQSIFRVYRFGQKKPCYVYRFLAMGTMEEKIYERQVTKQAISKRVIDEQQIDRHYAENDLAELYKFEPQPPVPRPIPPLPKDRLFAEMLREHEAQIYKYHEHDSLLENKEEETLSEEERKAAWEDFENEKNKPPPAPFPSPWPMHNGMVPSLIAQQQQQLAYAALGAMLRKDMPNLNDNQLRDMLPLIYNANPQMFGGYDYGLMQKMSEIYKYTQPGMMNPGMMNPGVMNPASGAGGLGGMSGASGLQYEPPWQRQQQQQQQMRLQQLMQQQNSMGAKFYAGGLGSRDPVAMALQQQRAREIMLGNSAAAAAAASTASRPRGRPPLQPRPPHHAPDVVDLDSD